MKKTIIIAVITAIVAGLATFFGTQKLVFQPAIAATRDTLSDYKSGYSNLYDSIQIYRNVDLMGYGEKRAAEITKAREDKETEITEANEKFKVSGLKLSYFQTVSNQLPVNGKVLSSIAENGARIDGVKSALSRFLFNWDDEKTDAFLEEITKDPTKAVKILIENGNAMQAMVNSDDGLAKEVKGLFNRVNKYVTHENKSDEEKFAQFFEKYGKKDTFTEELLADKDFGDLAKAKYKDSEDPTSDLLNDYCEWLFVKRWSGKVGETNFNLFMKAGQIILR